MNNISKGPMVHKALKELKMLDNDVDVEAYTIMADESESRTEYIQKLINYQDLNEEMEGYGFPTYAFTNLVFPETEVVYPENMPQRISLKVLIELEKEFGNVQVGCQTGTKAYNYLTLRFGYWREVDKNKLDSILGRLYTAYLELVDEDEECGKLWHYMIPLNK